MKNMTDFAAVNFDSFGEPLTSDEEAALRYEIKQDWRFYTKLGIISGVFAIVMSAILVPLANVPYHGLLPIAAYLIFIGIPLSFGPKTIAARQMRIIELKRFARLHGFTYDKSADNTSRSGTIFIKHSVGTTEDLICGPDFAIGRQEVKLPASKRNTTYYLLFAEVLLDRDMPHILIDGKQCQYWLRSYYSNAQEIRLEGNFGDYYRVYCPQRYETDLLYFLTPELMQLLLELNGEYDIEIVGRKLYFYGVSPTGNLRFDKTTLQQLFTMLAVVVPEFLDNIKNYDHMVASKQVAGKNYHGERLKKAAVVLAAPR